MAKLPKRCGNVKRKERRSASWQRTQERKSTRRSAQMARERVNREYRQRGEPTPAETAYERRRAYRRMVTVLRKAHGICARTLACQRPGSHKGQCGKLTQTEIRSADKLQTVS